ncbi:MAG: hypothetical protein WCF57_08105 [Pyrinomonadaceae bacterium]
MSWIVESVPDLKGFAVEWAAPGDFILSRRNQLFHSTSLKPPFKRIATIDAPSWKEAASKSRLAQRLLRFIVTNVVRLSNGDLFVTFDKTVGVVRDGKFQALAGLARPCRVLRSACAISPGGDIYFGEYLTNETRGAMRIYRYAPGADALRVAYTFPPNSIRHIHGLYFDEFTQSILCLTGDAEQESQILRSFDGFQTVEVVGRGDETWRAVSILFTEEALFYGMDAEFRANRIYKVDRKEAGRTSLCEVDGTVFYSKQLGANLFFTTTAENAPSQKENVAALWHVDEDEQCRNLISFKKDRWHPTLFMFGTIHFPGVNRLEHELYFQLVGVEGDNQTFRVRPA